jgi:hypothetical protein
MHRSAPATLQLARHRSHTHSSGAKKFQESQDKPASVFNEVRCGTGLAFDLGNAVTVPFAVGILGNIRPCGTDMRGGAQRKTPRPAFVQGGLPGLHHESGNAHIFEQLRREQSSR